MRKISRFAIVLALAGTALASTARDARSQQPAVVSVAAGYAAGIDTLREWDAAVDWMARTGDLVVTSRLPDRLLEGRAHEYLAQTFWGIPVHGGGISRQFDAAGVTVSLLGTLHQGIDVALDPALSGSEAAARLVAETGEEVFAGRRPALVILPLVNGSYALAYQVTASDGRFYFASAADGRILHVEDAFRRQSAIGVGTDQKGASKKLGTTREGGRYLAHDRTRPSEIVTLDARFNPLRYRRLLSGHLEDDLPAGEPVWTAGDVASDADNRWEDPWLVETHAHTGWTYDYFLARHGWAGIDGSNGRIASIVGSRFGANAFYAPPPFGPEGAGVYVYGRGFREASEEPFTSLDIVAHELMHGVTYHSVAGRTGNPFGLVNDTAVTYRPGPEAFTDEAGRTYTCHDPTFPFRIIRFDPDGGEPRSEFFRGVCRDGRFLLGSDQAGAVNEVFSDIVGESVGFFHEDAGASADYQVGGDSESGAIRSLSDPRSIRDYPDHYRNLIEMVLATDPDGATIYSQYWFVDGELVLVSPVPGYGGQHPNSLILSHAFYLAIEGGTNRTSGMTVDGVGGANREEVERIFFRAMTDLMPSASSLPQAADAIRQSAADLALGSDAQRAIEQALRAVGLG